MTGADITVASVDTGVQYDHRALANQHRGDNSVWTFQEITATVWKMPFLGDADMVLSAVKRLRRRVLVVTTELRILSVRGIGFRLTLLAAGETRCEHPLPRSEPA